MSELGQNVMAKIDGDILTLTVDLSKEGSLSGSKKSMVIGSTKGNRRMEYNGAGVMVGLNVYRKCD